MLLKKCWFIKIASSISFNLTQGFRYQQFNQNTLQSLVREFSSVQFIFPQDFD